MKVEPRHSPFPRCMMLLALFILLSIFVWVCINFAGRTHSPSNSVALNGNIENITLGKTATPAPIRSNAPKIRAALSYSPIENEKDAFYKKEGIGPYKKGLPFLVSFTHDPLMRFWMNRAMNSDPVKSEQAFQFFESVCISIEASQEAEFRNSLNADQKKIRELLERNRAIAEKFTMIAEANGNASDPGWASRELGNQSELHHFIIKLTERIHSHNTRDSAMRAANYLTFGIYEEKEPTWWISSFPNSKLAGIYSGEPPSVWMALSE